MLMENEPCFTTYFPEIYPVFHREIIPASFTYKSGRTL